jgi:hypothetical protein
MQLLKKIEARVLGLQLGLQGVIKFMGQDNLSMFKNLLKYCHESKKQVCDSFTYF